MGNGRLATLFQQAGMLARTTDIGILTVPDTLDRLDEIIPVLKCGRS